MTAPKLRKAKAAVRSATKTTKRSKTKTVRKTTAPDPEEVGARIRAVLLELMCASESDSVRVAAARALLDRLKTNGGEDDDARQNEEEERAAAIAEARELLAAFADAKSGGAGGAG